MKNPHIIWASVVIIFMLIGSVVVLTALGKDSTIIVTLAGLIAIPVLSAFGVAIYQKVDQVKELSNGGQQNLLKMIQKLQEVSTELALKVQPADPPKEVTKENDDT